MIKILEAAADVRSTSPGTSVLCFFYFSVG